jgi:hypothetical protein
MRAIERSAARSAAASSNSSSASGEYSRFLKADQHTAAMNSVAPT